MSPLFRSKLTLKDQIFKSCQKCGAIMRGILKVSGESAPRFDCHTCSNKKAR